MTDGDIRSLGERGRRQALVDNVDGTQYVLSYGTSTWASMSSTDWTNHAYTSHGSDGTSISCNGHYNNRGFSTYSDAHRSACPIVYSGIPKYMVTWHTYDYDGGVGGEYGVYVR